MCLPDVTPLLKAIQFLNVTGPIGPESPFVYKSHPSSTLLKAIHPSKTLPTPVVNLQANPSLSSPNGSWLS